MQVRVAYIVPGFSARIMIRPAVMTMMLYDNDGT